jgi:uncharacterized protein (DUF924 family)
MLGLVNRRSNFFTGLAVYATTQWMNTLTAALTTNAFDVQRLAETEFIKKALSNPHRPESFLSFFFRVDYDSPSDEYKTQLRNGKDIMDNMSKLWFGGGSEYDQLCQPFRSVVRDLGQQKVDWTTTTDGAIAQIILCDQMSRNIFRGSDEAYQYDTVALATATTLADELLSGQELNGEMFPPYLAFLILPLMHSESKVIHTKVTLLLEYAKANAPQLDDFWNLEATMENDHSAVIERFGRYPHRNAVKGRISTPEELQWLNDIENLPGWAKS